MGSLMVNLVDCEVVYVCVRVRVRAKWRCHNVVVCLGVNSRTTVIRENAART